MRARVALKWITLLSVMMLLIKDTAERLNVFIMPVKNIFKKYKQGHETGLGSSQILFPHEILVRMLIVCGRHLALNASSSFIMIDSHHTADFTLFCESMDANLKAKQI